ncbi:hypothetical protein DPMN_048173 [Dreissena polymorpha]|uniref:Uncharacterized protein n=1 Tax=Dreissena polymorpha TaxID=45954 RepID=A0A9D4D9G2_DREPO|nr:hypothetical protein DPMN_048173 [Dreissena polymorpha]
MNTLNSGKFRTPFRASCVRRPDLLMACRRTSTCSCPGVLTCDPCRCDLESSTERQEGSNYEHKQVLGIP